MSSTYSIDRGSTGISNVKQHEAVAAVVELVPGEKVTIENTTVEREYDVFYGADDINQGWSQHSVVKGTSHRDAAIAWLSHNYSEGTRILVVGFEPYRWSGNPKKVGRVFEINSVEEGDSRIVHTYTHRNDGYGWDYWDYYPRRCGSYVLPTKYYRIDEVCVVPKRR